MNGTLDRMEIPPAADLRAVARLTPAAALATFGSTLSGIEDEEAGRRRALHGRNQLQAISTTAWHILLRQFRSPFVYLLAGAAALSFFFHEVVDGYLIVLFILINACIGFYQEYHSERTLRLLRAYVVARSRVRRNGKETTVSSDQLVPGDIVLLSPGDRVPADVRFVETTNLALDDSVLTGESAPVPKTGAALDRDVRELHEAPNLGFSGTAVAAGKAVAVVIAIGAQTRLGAITKLTVETRHRSGVEAGISKFSSFILRLVVLTLVFLFIANLVIKGGSTNVPELLIFSIALAVSVTPEALPVVIAFSLSRGALRLAKQHVVVKRLSAVEDLGGIEVLCTDKTGTITENQLTVTDTFPAHDRSLLSLATLASSSWSEAREPNNAFDRALWKTLSGEEQDRARQTRILRELPFDPERRRNTVLVAQDQNANLVICRGAPETVLERCTATAQERAAVLAWTEDAGRRGQRSIAIAVRSISTQTESVDLETGLTFRGCITFVDPLKETALAAVRSAEQLGVQVKILTGDSAAVAGAVAKSIGLIANADAVLTGAALEQMSWKTKRAAVQQYHVFARVTPEQKYSIIELLQERFSVGFLGEGINDAPALKIADVALAVRGAADIAREAADILLLQKSLAVIVDGIRQGRQVFANTTKYIQSTLASNFGNFYTVAIASLFITYLPMLPIQILLVNLLSDFPMIAVATDRVDKDELRQPRSYDIKSIVLVATILGIVSTVFDFLFFALFFRQEPAVLQTMWFLGSVLTELVFIFSVRTKGFFLRAPKPSRLLLWLAIIAFGVTLLLPYLPQATTLFHFVRPSAIQLFTVLMIVGLYFGSTETVKRLYYRLAFHRHPDQHGHRPAANTPNRMSATTIR